MTLSTPSQGGDTFREGINYHLISSATSRQPDKDNIHVKEFFWYGCHTCYTLQPYIDHWLVTNTKNIRFERIAAMSHDNMELLARSYYAAIKLNLDKQLHIPLFAAIHDHKTVIETQEQLTSFLEKQNIDSKKFIKAMQSSEVSKQIRRARQLGKQLEIAGPPTVTINGIYRIDPSGVRSAREFIGLLDFLLEKQAE